MFNSITIKSSLEFIIVGPIGSSEIGILIRSNTLDIDLIGFANQVFNRNQLGYTNTLDFEDYFLRFEWSRNFNLFNRNAKFLFGYRKTRNKSFRPNYRSYRRLITENSNVQEELDRFLENTYDQFELIAESIEWNNEANIDQDKILWHISPLLLAGLKEEI